jgi:hypothetical protein
LRAAIPLAALYIASKPSLRRTLDLADADQRPVLVSAGDELEEQVRGVLLERQVADLVDDDQPVAAQPGELFGEQAPRW